MLYFGEESRLLGNMVNGKNPRCLCGQRSSYMELTDIGRGWELEIRSIRLWLDLLGPEIRMHVIIE